MYIYRKQLCKHHTYLEFGLNFTYLLLSIWLKFILTPGKIHVGSKLLLVTLGIHKPSLVFQGFRTHMIIFPLPRRQTFYRNSTMHFILISINHLSISLLTDLFILKKKTQTNRSFLKLLLLFCISPFVCFFFQPGLLIIRISWV